MKIRAAAYARYSTDLQKPTSIEDQFRVLQAKAVSEGWEIVQQYSDYELTGQSFHKRAGLAALRQDAKRGEFDIVLSEALDRLSRDQADTAILYREMTFNQVQLFTLSEGFCNAMIVGLKGIMNADYVQEIGRKTLRGQRGVAESGRIPSGLTYGYDIVRRFDAQGAPIRGERVIVEDEAKIIRRIFEEYAAGRSPIAIAQGLERDRIPSPQGKRYWSVSTINGCRKRHYGILNNDIYRGMLVWNRSKDVRDPETGKKIARPKPENEWVYKEMPHLRIISDDVWEATKVRQKSLEVKGGSWKKQRPRFLLSGLLRCGECGSPFIMHSKTRYACARKHSEVVCTHRLSIRRDEIEGAVLGALKARLMDPRLVKIFCDEYTRHMAELRKNQNATRSAYEAELARIARSHQRCIDSIKEGISGSHFKDELDRMAVRKAELETLLANCEVAPVLIHPAMAGHYHKQIAQLMSAISDQDIQNEAHEVIRGMVEKIVLTPNADNTALVVDLYGDLAGILAVAEEGERIHHLPRQLRIKAASGDGGRYKVRTCDPYDVNVVLYR